MHLLRDPLPRPDGGSSVTGRPVVIGVGNPSRRDDGVGWAVATAAGRRLGQLVDVRWCDGEPGRLLDAWTDAELAVVIDATFGAAEPGAIQLLSPSAAEERGPPPAWAPTRSVSGRPRRSAEPSADSHGRWSSWASKATTMGSATPCPGRAAAVEPAADLVARMVVGGVEPHGGADRQGGLCSTPSGPSEASTVAMPGAGEQGFTAAGIGRGALWRCSTT